MESSLVQDLLLNARLFLYLLGTFTYGFLARELIRRPSVLPGNRPMRFLAVSLGLWYAGCLLDELASILLPGAPGWLDACLDILRGASLLLALPLLAHAIWKMLPPRQRPAPTWLLPGYLSLLLFLSPLWEQVSGGGTSLTETARGSYALFVAHSMLSSGVACWLILLALRQDRDPRFRTFLGWLFASIVLTAGLHAGSLIVLRAGEGQGWGQALWFFTVQSSGLVLGLTFLYFVQRYNLLQLTLSYTALRHFLLITLFVLLVMLSRPAVGTEGAEAYRRFLAWGLMVALLAGLLVPLAERAARRSALARRLLGRALPAEEMERITRPFRSPELGEDEMLERTAAGLGRVLRTGVRFLPESRPAGPEGRALARIHGHFEARDARAFSRIDVPGDALARALEVLGLHAVFPLRVREETIAVLALELGPTGGGYEVRDMESVRLVLRQLALALEVRRLAEDRVEVERRLAEQESLGLLGLVSASLAHEIKNPLSSMKALAQTLHEEIEAEEPDGPRSHDLRVIIEQMGRLEAVSGEILGLARPPGGDEVDLDGLLGSALYVLGPEARRRGVSLASEGVRPVGRVPGSPAAWQTILFNLLLNAVRHAPEGSEVGVSLRPSDGKVTFETRNAGPAIPPEVERRLFEPFVTQDGTGLGLALVARRLEEIGAVVELRNDEGRILFRVTAPGRRPAEANGDGEDA